MDKKRNKLELSHWIDFCQSLQPGDILLEETKDILGRLISWGTGDQSNIDPSHTLMYLGDGSGKIIEATNKGTVFDVIEKYKDKVINGKSRLVVFRIIDLVITDFEKIKSKANEIVGYKYGFLSYIGWCVYGIVNKFTPLGGLFRLNILKNPFSKKNKPICSQVIFILMEQICWLKKILLDENYVYENFIPETLDRFIRKNPDIFVKVNDTVKYYYV